MYNIFVLIYLEQVNRIFRDKHNQKCYLVSTFVKKSVIFKWKKRQGTINKLHINYDTFRFFLWEKKRKRVYGAT